MILSENKFKFTLRIENEKPIYYFDGDEKSERDVKKTFQNKQILSFLYDEEYEDWMYTTRPLHERNRLLVFVDKLLFWHNRQRKFKFIQKTEYYVFIIFKIVIMILLVLQSFLRFQKSILLLLVGYRLLIVIIFAMMYLALGMILHSRKSSLIL
jgi:hypothetical protein